MSYSLKKSPLITMLVTITIIAAITMNGMADSFTVTEEPKNLGIPVNSIKNDFSPTISPDGTFMIFNSNRDGRYQDLYISYNKDGKWQTPKRLSSLNSPYNDETPFLSADGKILIFSSDRDGSKEMPKNHLNQIRVSFDLYWSKLVNNKWTSPVQIPGDVNTSNHEKTATLSKDGKTIYYTSYAFGRMRELKVIKAEKKNGRFVNPTPLSAPFNTGHQDLAVIPAEDLKGFFFSSNRKDSIGMWDLYFVPYVDGKFGKVENLGDKINSKGSEIYLSRVDQRYYISSLREGGKGLFDIYSSYIFQKDVNFETRAIHFDFNSHVIKKESYPYLNALSNFLKKHNNLKIEIIGHTDLHGTVEFNNKLSKKRAASVLDYLVRKSIKAKRFKLSGMGKNRPLVNKTGKGYDELNRRTEFKLLK